MASFQKVYYCKNCKTNVSVDDKGHCKKCGGSSISTTWSTRFRYVQENGGEVQKRLSGFQTKKEAQEALIDFNIAHNQKYRKTKSLVFDKLYEEFKSYYKMRIKESSFHDFCSQCDLHIINYFKDYEVKKITPKIILVWQNSLNHLSYQYKNHIRSCLSLLLKYAEKYYDIPNQLIKVDKFKRIEPKKEITVWSPEQFKNVMDHVEKFEYKAFYTALYYTGARKGEMLATFVEDWDLVNKTLTIKKTITNKTSNGAWIITSPKTNSSIRKIKIPDTLAKIMRSLFENNKDRSSKNFAFGGNSPLPTTCICRHLNNAAQAANIKPIRIHDLRHSHASLLINQGVSIVAVAKRLGHSSIEQTLNTYAHLMPNEEDDLIKKLQCATIL